MVRAHALMTPTAPARRAAPNGTGRARSDTGRVAAEAASMGTGTFDSAVGMVPVEGSAGRQLTTMVVPDARQLFVSEVSLTAFWSSAQASRK